MAWEEKLARDFNEQLVLAVYVQPEACKLPKGGNFPVEHDVEMADIDDNFF